MTMDLERALPSVACLIGLLFLPASARRSLRVHKASQIFEIQQTNLPIGVSRPVKKDIPYGKNAMQGFLLFLAIFSLPMVLFATSGGDWQSNRPIFALCRDAIPQIYLIAFMTTAVKQAMTDVAVRIEDTESRKSKIQHMLQDYAWITRQITKDSLHSWVSSIAISTIVVWLSQKFIPQSEILLSCGASIFTAVRRMPIYRTKLSFKFFVLGPLLSATAYLVLQGGIYAIFYICEAIFGKIELSSGELSPISDASGDLPSSWGWDKMEEDVASMQWWVIVQTLACGFFIWPVCHLVCLAYRYDAAQAGRALISEQEELDVSATVEMESPLDLNGCHYANYKDVAVPASTPIFDMDRSPTYKAAFYTLLSTQIAGILFDIFFGLPVSVYYPTKKDQLPPANALIILSFWPLLAYVFVILAMIFSSHRHSEGGIKCLWEYDEE
jgi:hypothetical protein